MPLTPSAAPTTQPGPDPVRRRPSVTVHPAPIPPSPTTALDIGMPSVFMRWTRQTTPPRRCPGSWRPRSDPQKAPADYTSEVLVHGQGSSGVASLVPGRAPCQALPRGDVGSRSSPTASIESLSEQHKPRLSEASPNVPHWSGVRLSTARAPTKIPNLGLSAPGATSGDVVALATNTGHTSGGWEFQDPRHKSKMGLGVSWGSLYSCPHLAGANKS